MSEDPGTALAAKFAALLPHLDERQRRLAVAAEARSIGHGGIRLAARAARMREATVSLGDRVGVRAGSAGPGPSPRWGP